jgi:cytoplasmic iron level regulating protein YaaA (DUF328/UPF0246 family)
MLLLLSPAKSLDYETALPQIAATTPLFVARSAELITTLQKKSARQIAELMDLSEALAALNVQRYKSWSPEFSDENARPAVLAFNGDVYEGLVQARVIDCVFQDHKNGQYKIISFFAKRARGLMARFAIQKQVKSPLALQAFNMEGYAYAADVSDDNTWVFRRHTSD